MQDTTDLLVYCFQEGASMVKKIKGSFLFKIKGSDGKVYEWLVDLKSPPGSVTKGTGISNTLRCRY